MFFELIHINILIHIHMLITALLVDLLEGLCYTDRKPQRMGTVWHTTDGIQSQYAYCY